MEINFSGFLLTLKREEINCHPPKKNILSVNRKSHDPIDPLRSLINSAMPKQSSCTVVLAFESVGEIPSGTIQGLS